MHGDDARRHAERRGDGREDGHQRLNDELPNFLILHDFRVKILELRVKDCRLRRVKLKN